MSTFYGGLGGSNTASDLYTVSSSATLSSIGATGFGLTGLAIDPTTGTLYGSTNANSAAHPKSLVTIDPVTGAATFVASLGSIPIADIDFISTGQLYGVRGSDLKLVSINKTTGTVTLIGPAVGYGSPVIAINRNTDTAYNSGSSGDIYTINLATGDVTLLVSHSGASIPSFPAAGSVGPTGDIWVGVSAAAGHLYSISPTTGVVTDRGMFSLGLVDALAWDIGDTTPPTLTSITTLAPDTIVLTYDEALLVSPGPSISEFTVTADGSPLTVVSSVASGAEVTLTVTPEFTIGQDVRVSYTA